jgi:pimeloyl-[acyl-carrier protein] synthase
MLGIPDENSGDFAYWAEQVVQSLEPSHQSEAALRKQEKAARDAEAFFTEMVRIRRAAPGPDIISALLEVERAEDLRVTTQEIVAMCVLLHIAGHETTGHLIGTTIHNLWSRPDQLALLEADRARIPAAIEEVLRWDGPARNSTPRRAWIDKTIGGQSIPAGDVVYAILGAANRDEAVFEDPNRFDVTRENNRHIAFGLGIHFCLGAHLARMESACAVDALLSAPRRLAVQPDVVWRDSFTIRGLEALPGWWE